MSVNLCAFYLLPFSSSLEEITRPKPCSVKNERAGITTGMLERCGGPYLCNLAAPQVSLYHNEARGGDACTTGDQHG